MNDKKKLTSQVVDGSLGTASEGGQGSGHRRQSFRRRAAGAGQHDQLRQRRRARRPLEDHVLKLVRDGHRTAQGTLQKKCCAFDKRGLILRTFWRNLVEHTDG